MAQDYKLFELKLKTRRFFNATHGCCSFLSLYAKCLKFVLFENSVCVFGCVRVCVCARAKKEKDWCKKPYHKS